MSVRFFLSSLCSAWMIGIGFRLFMEGFHGDWYTVKVSGFEWFFDWYMLFVLGVILFVYSVWSELKNYNGDEKV